MENEKGIMMLSRRQIYDEIWKISVSGVARKYNLNYAKLIESCKKANIPFPSSGYWTRLNFGKDVSAEIVPLSGNKNELIKLTTNAPAIKKIKKVKSEIQVPENGNFEKTEIKEEIIFPKVEGILAFLEDDEKQRVVQTAYSLEVNENVKFHRCLIQYKKKVFEYNKIANGPGFFKEVSEDGMKRFMVILDAIFKAIEKLGGSVNDDLSVKIRSEIVHFRVAESKDKIKHELTRQEAQELVKYQDEVKRHSWASKPQIRQYDYVYNGKIRIVFGERSYIRDSEKEKLEDKLGDILISLYEKSEENRIDRERREEEQRRREEEARIKEEVRKRRETEIKLTKELENKAEDYKLASDIRIYINAMIENRNEHITSEWINWARNKADWYDPTIAREDEYLGKRNHGKNKEEKELDKTSIRRSWYW